MIFYQNLNENGKYQQITLKLEMDVSSWKGLEGPLSLNGLNWFSCQWTLPYTQWSRNSQCSSLLYTYISRHLDLGFGLGFGHRTARIASSNTVFRPFCVRAEHSKYFVAFMSFAIANPCKTKKKFQWSSLKIERVEPWQGNTKTGIRSASKPEWLLIWYRGT